MNHFAFMKCSFVLFFVFSHCRWPPPPPPSSSTVVVPHSVLCSFSKLQLFFCGCCCCFYFFHSLKYLLVRLFARSVVRLPVKYISICWTAMCCVPGLTAVLLWKWSSGRMSAVIVNQLLYWTVYRSWSNTNVYIHLDSLFLSLNISLFSLLLSSMTYLRTFFSLHCAYNRPNECAKIEASHSTPTKKCFQWFRINE